MRIAVILAASLLSAAAYAQQSTVNVDVSGVRDQIAQSINVPADRIPVAVQVAPEVAADVCKVDARLFATQDGANCAAKATSAALNAAVQQRLKS
jgi:hypothetical protein